jgi:hypothetical protein
MYSIETREEVFILPHKYRVVKGIVILGSPVYVPNGYELPIKSLNTSKHDPYEEIFEAIYLSKFAHEVMIPESKIETIAETNKDERGLDCIDGTPIFPTLEHVWTYLASDYYHWINRWLTESTHKPILTNIFGLFKCYDEIYYNRHIEPILDYLYAVPDDI